MVYALPALHDIPVAFGGNLTSSITLEFGIQQMIDVLAYGQIDAGTYIGHWYYNLVNGTFGSGLTESLSYVAQVLSAVEERGKSYG